MSCRSMTMMSRPGEHGVGRPSRVAVERVNRQAGLLVPRRWHLVVEDAANAVLGAEERHQLHTRRLVEHDRLCVAPIGRASRVVGDKADALALERREAVAREDVDAGCDRPGARRSGGCDCGAQRMRMRREVRAGHLTGRLRDVRSTSELPCSTLSAAAAAWRPAPAKWRDVALAIRMQAAREKDRRNAARYGSIQIDVPVNPVCPNEPIGKSSPRLDENDVSISQPRPRTLGMPAGVAGVVIFATVAGDRTGMLPRRPLSDEHPREARQIACRAEQPGMTSDAAHPPRRGIVNDPTERRRSRRIAWPRGHHVAALRRRNPRAFRGRRIELRCRSCQAAGKSHACTY